MKTHVGRDGTALEDLSACDAPPLELLTAEQAEERQKNDPQIIRRVEGAKYILLLDTGGAPMPSARVEQIRTVFKTWWESDAPVLLVHYPARVEVILLPEATE